MRALAALIVFLFISSTVSGCLSNESSEELSSSSILDEICPDGFANNTWYHFPNSTNILSIDNDVLNSILIGENVPVCAKGTYYGIGVSTFEPTIGITSAAVSYTHLTLPTKRIV